MIFKRQKYLEKLIAGQGNGMVKIVTGGRRCGKSFLLFNIFHQYLISRVFNLLYPVYYHLS